MDVMPAMRPPDEVVDHAELSDTRRDATDPRTEEDEGLVEEQEVNGGEPLEAMKDQVKAGDEPSPRGYHVEPSKRSPPRVAPSAAASLGGGVYIPPAKRRQMMKEQEAFQEDNASVNTQRQTWQDQKRVVHGTINRLNSATIKPLIHELFQKVNLIRLRGVLARSVLQAAITSTQYSNVYAALVAVINTKLPEVGELVVKRAILQFRRHYRRREKTLCLAVSIFLGHLFHQAVVHELLVLQILTVLLDGDPTDDSVEVAIQFLTTVGQALLEVSPAGVRAVLERLRALLHEGSLKARVEYKMEQLLALRKTGFRDYPPITDDLDLVERDDQITFELSLDDEDISKEEKLDVFQVDPNYDESEQEWSKIRAEILGLGGDDEDDSSGESETDGSDGESSDDESQALEDASAEEEAAVVPVSTSETTPIQDLSEADLIHLRRNIYLTIMSSATFEECVHKLTKINIPPGREEELINMIIECCSQERTFLRYYGLISARFCLLEDRWTEAYLSAFAEQYNTIHRLETNKLRNVAKLFAHLLHTDSVPWSCLSIIHLNEDETTSSSRIFIKILIQEIAEAIGIGRLKDRFETQDPELAEWYKGMFPRDNVRNTRYAINYFTTIGLGPLTDGLREFLKNAPKMIMAQAQQQEADDDSSVSSTSSSSTDSSSLSTSSYTSSSSSSSYSSYSSRGRSSKRTSRRRSRSYSSSSYSSRSSSSSRSSYSSYSTRSVSRSRSSSPHNRKRKRSRSYSSSSRGSMSPSRSPLLRKNRISRSRSNSPKRGKQHDRNSRSRSGDPSDRDRRSSSNGKGSDVHRRKRPRRDRSRSSSRSG